MTIPASSTKIALRASRAGDWKPDKRGLMPLAAARDLLKRKRIIHCPRDAELSRALLQQCAAPSKSAMYLSLAKALTARDPSLVQLGESNLDFRLHAVNRTR